MRVTELFALLLLTSCGGSLLPLDSMGPPTVRSFSPRESVGEGGGTLTLTGTRFRSGMSVRLGNLECAEVTVVNENSATCRIPASVDPSWVAVSVTAPGQLTGFAPEGFYFYPQGNLLWLNATDLLTQADGTALSHWRDQSGGGRDPNQSTPALRPTVLANAINGLPVTHFAGVYPDGGGTNPYLLLGAPFSSVFKFATTSDFSLALIFRSTITGLFHQIIANESANNRVGFGFAIDGFSTNMVGFPFAHSRDTCCPAAFGIYPVNDGSWHRAVVVRKSGALNLYIDGALQGSVASGTAVDISAAQNLFIGRDPNNYFPWGGDLAEVLITLHPFSLSEITAFDTYWKSKYAL